MVEKRPALGRGLSALIPDAAVPAVDERSLDVDSDLLRPNRFQPRTAMDEAKIEELARSIRANGIIQPIVARRVEGGYEIVAGERRWRAAQIAKLHEVPVIIRPFSDAQSLEIAIIENVQRSDLTAIEEAAAYQELMNRFQYTQEQVSEVIGKSRSHIANTLRLLKLPESVKTLIAEGKLSAGHARALVGSPNPDALAREILAGALNVRQAEKKVQTPRAGGKKPAGKDADTKALEHSLSNSLGMEVNIEHQGKKGGQVKINYRTLEQLDEIIRRLNSYGEVD